MREKERERNVNVERCLDWLPLKHPQLGTWLAPQACAVIGNLTSNLSIQRPALNPLSHTSQGRRKRFEEISHSFEEECLQMLFRFGMVLSVLLPSLCKML